MTDRTDSLGRKIPVYDRSAAGKKSAVTRKEKHGADVHARAGANGGKRRTRGYFGYLADHGETDKLHAISQKGGQKAAERKRVDSLDRDGR